MLLNEVGNEIIESKIFPIFIGGDHSITCHLLRDYLIKNSLNVVIFDAHLDNGIVESNYVEHGNFISTLVSNPNVKYIFYIGFRGVYKKYNNNKFVYIENEKQLEKCNIDNFYLSIDFDVFDPSIMQSVNYPVPSGLLFKDYERFLYKLNLDKCIGCDFVEFNYTKQGDEVSLSTAISALLALIFAKMRGEKG